MLLAALTACRGKTPPPHFTVRGPSVRVQVLSDQPGPVNLEAEGPVRISTLPDLVLRFQGDLPRRAAVQAEGEGFRIGGQFYPSPLRIAPAGEAPLAIQASAASGAAPATRAFRGVLDLFNLSGRLRLINELSMEEYLAGVVGGEMPGHFPAAALESQAIVSRTYALYHLRSGRDRPLSVGFNATSEFQVYRGLSGENARARRAVEATAGWVLTYQGRLFPAYYHSTCGGKTASAAWVFGESEIPPLRGVSCDRCAASPHYRWSLVLSLRQVEAALRPWAEARGVKLGEVRGLEEVETLSGGYLRYVRVLHGGGSFEVRADRFRGLLLKAGSSGVRSTSFRVRRGAEPGTVELQGAGWGHGVGLCQYGAGSRARDTTHGQVLAHYFPESEMKKVW